jgi:hypothetical protein
MSAGEQQHSRRARWGVLAVAAVLVCTTVALAVFADGQHSFWTARPFLGQVMISLLTLALTVVIIDRVRVGRDNRRWRRIAIVAYRSVARASRDVTTGLTVLYSDPSRTSGHKLEGGSQGRTRDLDPLDEIRSLPAGKEGLAIFKRRLPPDEPTYDDLIPPARLKCLLLDADWCRFATLHVSALVDANRDAVAKWAPLMMSADEPRTLLDAFASLNDELFILAIALRRGTDRELDERAIESTLRAWRTADGKARILTNTLWRHANGGRYSLLLPPALKQVGLAKAFRTSARIKGWSVTDGAPVDRDPFSPVA